MLSTLDITYFVLFHSSPFQFNFLNFYKQCLKFSVIASTSYCKEPLKDLNKHSQMKSIIPPLPIPGKKNFPKYNFL